MVTSPAVELILLPRPLIVSGMGKSGHIARKIAATMASTGTPAYFVHPAEASHGDLGMITRNDVLLALSNSGETEELLRIVPLVKRQGATADFHDRLADLNAGPRIRCTP
jgi:arabinose-5-phosphate isomerase